MIPNATVNWPDGATERVRIESIVGSHVWVSRAYKDDGRDEVVRVREEWLTRDPMKAKKKYSGPLDPYANGDS